jgi:hypothetical protein
MSDEYVEPEFPEMENPPADWENDSNEIGEVFEDEVVDPQGGEVEVSAEIREQVDLELIESSPISPVFSEYPPREAPRALSEDSGGTLFLPDDDPIQQPLIANPLDPRLVYTRSVSRRLRHLTCERRGAEYTRPSGLYRPGG